MATSRLTFDNGRGHQLAARLELPQGEAVGYALFAHCFTCGKDVKAATTIARALAQQGYGVLRFDFTGLGSSDGDFANENFSSNVEDLVAAAEFMASAGTPISLLVGHSLGGAAVLKAAGQIDSVKAVATVAAPADPDHVTKLLRCDRETIETTGEAQVDLAGRTFTIKRQFLEDLSQASLSEAIANLRRPLLILHAPRDETVGVDNASRIFLAAKHPKSFVALDGADHLLRRKEDAAFAGQIIATWAGRYLGPQPTTTAPATSRPGHVHTVTTADNFRTPVQLGPHTITADEPLDAGGDDTGPSPYDLLLAALGTCTTMTLQMYARRKGWALRAARAHLSHSKVRGEDCADCPDSAASKIDVIERRIELDGDLDADQRARLMEIADKCPVHRTLHSELLVRTTQLSDDK